MIMIIMMIMTTIMIIVIMMVFSKLENPFSKCRAGALCIPLLSRSTSKSGQKLRNVETGQVLVKSVLSCYNKPWMGVPGSFILFIPLWNFLF